MMMKNCLFVGATNQKPLQQKEEMHVSNVNHGKILPLYKPPAS
jgi:hypothetical protein